MTTFTIALGGAFGAVARFWLSVWTERLNSSTFPLGTFTVNVLGSFLMGVLFIILLQRIELEASLRPLLMTGFLGAMTTFSTFSLDALLLFHQGHYNTALFYVLSSVIVCLFAAFAGMQISRLFF